MPRVTAKSGNIVPQISQKREKNFVAGLSMGGYGAFKMALGSNQFSYAASLSGALLGDPNFPGRTTWQSPAYWSGIFGDMDQLQGSENDVIALAKTQAQTPPVRPKLYAWIGEQDYLYHNNLTTIPQIQALGYDVTFETSPGTHDWYYWDQHIERVLEWLPINYQPEERLS